MCITVKLNPWDSIGSYLEWGPSALTMATPIERLNTGKKPLCQICVQRKKPSMSNMATLPLCRFRFSSTSYFNIPPATAFVVDYSFISNGAKKLMSNMDSPVTCSLHLQQSPPNHFRAMVRRMSDKMESEFAAI